MKRDTLKWILVAAVVVAAAAYLYFSERKPNEKQGQRKARTEQVAIAEGHSKAFKIEPMEGITISAPVNALDKDREFKLTAVDDKTYDRWTKAMKAEGMKPLMIFDLDAGLKPDEYFPGDYDVVMDLNKMGIPSDLQERVCVYRIAGKGKNEECIRYSSRISNGKLHYRSNQNSLVVLCLAPFAVKAFLGGLASVGKRIFEWSGSPGQWFQTYFMNEPTRLCIPIQDESGDFALYFRFRDTERPDGFDDYMKTEKAFFERLGILEEYAQNEYERRVKQQMEKEGIWAWEDWFSTKQVQAIRESISVEQILQDTAQKDTELIRLGTAPEGQLPQSVLTIKDEIIRANQYLNSIGLHHLDFELPVYLVNDDVMTSSINGAAKKYNFCGNAFMLVNYTTSRLVGQGSQVWEKMQCTLVHELCHVRQQCYYAFIMMNGAPAEGSVVVMERDAARGWFKSGLFETNPDTEVGLKAILTGRDDKFIFSYPLDKATSSAGSVGAKDSDWAYTIGYAIEGIRKGVGKESVNIKPFLDKYSFSGPHVKGWTGWIKSALEIDDAQLNEGWKYFGETHLDLIYGSQNSSNCPKPAATTVVELSPQHPVAQLKSISKPRDYSVNTFRIDLPSERIPGKGYVSTNGNVFVYFKGKGDGPEESNPYLTFYLSANSFAECKSENDTRLRTQPSSYCKADQSSYQLAAVATAQSQGVKLDYYVAALFAPDTPKIRRVKDDQISFVMPRPDRDLTKNGLITGAVVSYVDKNGDTLTHNVDPKHFGKKVKWTVSGASKQGNGFGLSLHWYYKPDANTTYVSPESEAAVWGAKDDKKKEEPTANQKKPETNYWKQVASRGHIESTSIEDEKSTGDEVSSDYRSIAMKMAKSGNVVEFTGMAATEEKTSEGRTYVKDIYLEGEITYTEPPTEWVAGTEYKGVWEVEDDPYLMRIKEPFEFVATVTSSAEKACVQSRREKTDTGRSKEGGVQWLRNYTSTYMARHPEKDDPKAFTLTQTFTIAELPGSSLKATFILEYDYEWVGEPEEEVEEEPDGSYWKLVKVYEDDTKAKYENRGKGDWYQLFDITGGGSRFNLKIEQTMYGNSGSVSQSASIVAPKQIYHPGESVAFDHTLGEPSITGHSFNGGAADIYVLTLRRVLTNKQYKLGERGNEGIGGAFVSRQYPNPDLSNMIVPAHDEWNNTFTIVDNAKAGAGATEVWHCTVYEYQWVEAGQKPKQENVSGGHWKLSNTVVSNEPGMMSGGSDIVTVQGGNGNYNAHVERDGEISDREIRFDKPKTVYRPGEQITLNITNDKAKTKNTKDGIVYGVVDFSTAQPGQSTDYPAMDKHPSYNSGKVKGTATGVAPQSGKPGVVDFSITEQIMVKGSYTKTHTTYYYVWEE